MSPGMVTTELLMSGASTPTAKYFINCLGECMMMPGGRSIPSGHMENGELHLRDRVGGQKRADKEDRGKAQN